MRKRSHGYAALAALLLASGCGTATDDSTQGQEIADSMNDAIERAEAVEDVALQHKDRLDDALESAAGERDDEP